MLTDDQRKRLNENLDPRWIKNRPQAGQTLSYVEGWYVIDRLNEIIGSGSWSYDVPDPRLVVDEERDGGTDRNGKPKGMRWHVTYTARCVLKVGDATICDWGTGHGVDKDRGAAHESAIKEAATDALKRAAKSLGRSMGLALYDKAQEHVAEVPPEAPSDADVGKVLAMLANATSRDDLNRARTAWIELSRTATREQADQVAAAGKAANERIKAATKQEAA